MPLAFKWICLLCARGLFCKIIVFPLLHRFQHARGRGRTRGLFVFFFKLEIGQGHAHGHVGNGNRGAWNCNFLINDYANKSTN